MLVCRIIRVVVSEVRFASCRLAGALPDHQESRTICVLARLSVTIQAAQAPSTEYLARERW
jgi:hypothetical protein